MKDKLTKKQLILEVCMEKLINFFDGILAGKGKKYAPWLMSMAIFIGASNIIGIFGFYSGFQKGIALFHIKWLSKENVFKCVCVFMHSNV